MLISIWLQCAPEFESNNRSMNISRSKQEFRHFSIFVVLIWEQCERLNGEEI